MSSTSEITLGELILIIWRFLKKYWLLLVIFLILGIIAGYRQKKKTKVYYTSTMVVSSDINYKLSTYYYPNVYPLYTVLNQIQTAFSLGNYTFLRDSVGFKNYSKIKSFSVSLSEYKYYSPSEIIIKVSTYDKEIFPEISQALVNYCNSNPYLLKFVEGQKRLDEFAKNSFDTAWQSILEREKKFGKNISDLNYVVIYFDKRLEASSYLAKHSDYKPLVIAKDFDPNPVGKSNANKKFLFVVIVFILLGFATAFLIEIIRFVKNAGKN